MYYYVSQKNENKGSGTKSDPFRTIGQAADIAEPGDTIVIGNGIYREWVSPKNGGLDNNQRITYINAEEEHPIISGAEIIDGWTLFKGTVWYTTVINARFCGYNPYSDEIFGDWYDSLGQTHHTGDVFMDGTAMYEVSSLNDLLSGSGSEDGHLRWYAVVDDFSTTFYCDFGTYDPNNHCTEISVRPYCFFPDREGINYITVSGLTMCQAATQWAPPTAFQPGLIGPHWSKGWIIENCKIHDSKCSGISLGKKRDQKDNCWSKDPSKSGTQTYTEIIFSNLLDGWNKEKIGGHIIRNNEIFNCGQTGIVGCMGGAFSDIIGNHIHHINVRQEFSGAEIAGIKLHAAIDTVIEKNIVHDCTRGLWLDWEAQGTEVRKNAFFQNNETEDLFIEVCQGPCLVENNLFLSNQNLLNLSQGTAFVHNLFSGKLQAMPDTRRFTMYHMPHSTAVRGIILVYGGDDRIRNNIFIGHDTENRIAGTYGTECYESYRHTPAVKTMENDTPDYDIGQTLMTIVCDNAYLNGAKCCSHEINPRVISDFHAEVQVTESNGHYWLRTNLEEMKDSLSASIITTAILGKTFEAEQSYENRDGSPICVNSDFSDQPRGERSTIGPFEHFSGRILLV